MKAEEKLKSTDLYNGRKSNKIKCNDKFYLFLLLQFLKMNRKC